MQTQQLERTINSREVAKQVGKRHGDLVRDIEVYIDYISQNADLRSDDFFIESSYKAGTGKSYKCYECTKRGCEMIAHKTTGKKGVQFTAFYVNKFNQLEEYAKQPPLPKSPMEILSVTFDALKQTDEKIENVSSRVSEIEENTPIHPSFLQEITKKRLARVTFFLGGKKSQAYKNRSFRDSVYAEAARDFKEQFKVNKYSLTLSKDIPSALKYFETWMPKEETLEEIRRLNSQIELLEEN